MAENKLALLTPKELGFVEPDKRQLVATINLVIQNTFTGNNCVHIDPESETFHQALETVLPRGTRSVVPKIDKILALLSDMEKDGALGGWKAIEVHTTDGDHYVSLQYKP